MFLVIRSFCFGQHKVHSWNSVFSVAHRHAPSQFFVFAFLTRCFTLLEYSIFICVYYWKFRKEGQLFKVYPMGLVLGSVVKMPLGILTSHI